MKRLVKIKKICITCSLNDDTFFKIEKQAAIESVYKKNVQFCNDKTIECCEECACTHTFYNKGYCLEKITRQNRRIPYQNTIPNRADPEVILKKGATLLKDHQKYEDALKCFDEFIAIKKDDPTAYLYKAICLKSLNKYSEAIESYNEVIKLNIGKDLGLTMNSFFNKALCFEKISEYEKAIECYTEVIKLEKNSELALYNQAVCYKIIKKNREANKCYQALSKINPFFIEFKNCDIIKE